MLRRSLIALAILVMLPAAASAGSFTYYGPQLGFSPVHPVCGRQPPALPH